MIRALDPVIHQRVRLAIVGLLRPLDKAEFGFIRDELQVSDSSLSQHLSTLEESGYVTIQKGFVGKRPRTWVRLNEHGRRALARYLDDLQSLLGADLAE